MKQDGASLVFVLIILLLVSGASVALFNSSLLEYKTSQQMQQRTDDFYQTESCLNNFMAQLKPETTHKTLTLPNINLQNLHWWQNFGSPCSTGIWGNIQILEQTNDLQATYFQITVYNKKHIMLQAIAKVTVKKQITLESWRQIIV